MITKEIGKISNIYLGMGGYQDVMFGITVTLEGPSWVSVDFKGGWPLEASSAQEKIDRYRNTMGTTMSWICDVMRQAKVDRLDKLTDKPIEATFTDGTLTSWRILTEVL